MALWVDDLTLAIDDFAAQGMPLVQLSETATGTRYAFDDARSTLGHMLELYEPTEQLTGFYKFVCEAAQGWDGSDVIRTIGEEHDRPR